MDCSRLSDPTLYVVVPLSNPIGYRRRTQLFREMIHRLCQTAERLQRPALNRPAIFLHVLAVELAFDNDPHVINQIQAALPPTQVEHLSALALRMLRRGGTIWNKSNLVNLGLQNLMQRGLPPQSVVGWLDADIEWLTDDWVCATLVEFQDPRARQQYNNNTPFLVQMFESASFLVSSVTFFVSENSTSASDM